MVGGLLVQAVGLVEEHAEEPAVSAKGRYIHHQTPLLVVLTKQPLPVDQNVPLLSTDMDHNHLLP